VLGTTPSFGIQKPKCLKKTIKKKHFLTQKMVLVPQLKFVATNFWEEQLQIGMLS
jgi:hypothetical protein